MYIRVATLILSMLLLLLAASPVAADEADEASLDILVTTLQANRKAMVAVNLKLTDVEASTFWPVYDRYDRERAEVRDRLISLIEDYSIRFRTLSDENATQILQDYLAIETDRHSLREKYLAQFAEAIPPRTLLRFYQLENKIDAVLRYELARTIPVLEERS